MDPNNIPLILGGIFTMLTGILTLLNFRLNRNKTVAETKADSTEGDLNIGKTAQVSIELFQRTNDELRRMLKEQAESFEAQLIEMRARYEKRIADLEDRLKKAESNYATEKKAREDMEIVFTKTKDWADRLVHQVISLGDEPVPFEPKRPGGKA